MQNYKFDFSVVILCYNPDIERLKRTIISVYKQKNISHEIIICDDGSKLDYKDELIKWCSTLTIPIKYSFLNKNVGTVKNYLEGVRLAEGKYVKVISPGDYLFDENSLKEFLKKLPDGPCLSFCDCYFYHDNKVVGCKLFPKNYKLFKQKSNFKKEYILYQNHFVGAAMCVERECLLDILNRVNGLVTLSEDYTITVQAIMDSIPIIPIKKRLMWYEYQAGGSINAKVNSIVLSDMLRINKYLIDNYEDDKVIKKLKKLEALRTSNNKYGFLKKLFVYLFVLPDYLIYQFRFKIRRVKVPDIDIDKMINITTLEDK